ncbi:dolichyl-phosphate-mannose-protein mannosyltransferase [Thiogranum longum]|uniref:Dolichyl-phosphate-mannose-protein mannosyltransferase n=1 Tax=Thiogranum longum TaxID=1537524 RepID=A0A4R1HDD2_9GAMM|nr:glycosyltransferase family 39 protein [Thiogranum longum]TCK18160.1 dolichyl-phosphate-mannose-protein mannosyltransferase [Thiogranum longum]
MSVHTTDAGTNTNILTLGLTILAFLTRFYALPDGGFTGDEVYTVDFAAERVRSIINPAYYALTLLSFKLFGVSELSARLPAMLIGALSVPVFFVTWRNLVGRNAALIGALLIIFSAWHLWYSQFSRFYTGAFLFGSLSYYLFYQALLRDDLGRLTWALVAAAVGFLFHATVVMVPVSFGAYALLVVLGRGSAQAGLSQRVARIYLALCALGALGAVAFIWDIWQGRQARGVSWGDGPGEMLLQIIRNVQLPVAVSAFFGLLVLLRRNAWLGMYFLVGIALPAAFVLVASSFLNSRSVYLFYALPLIIVLAGVLCEEARRALASQGRLVSWSLTAILLATMTPEFLSHYTGRHSLDVRAAVAYIDAARRPGDIVISFPVEFDYYARGKYPVIHGLGNPRAVRRDRSEKISSVVTGYERAWVVVNTGRKPLARDLETWFGEHGSLVWRRSEKRLDYIVRGYEIFLIDLAPGPDAK